MSHHPAVKVNCKQASNTRTYHDEVVLSYDIRYPQFGSRKFQKSLCTINPYYVRRAEAFQLYLEEELLQNATEQYQYSMENGFPFHPFESILEYTITYNRDCLLSLYTDKYEFMGGAHGGTERTSETWNLVTGRKEGLAGIFSCMERYDDYILHNIRKQIEAQIASGVNPYFEDIAKLVEENFDEFNFYLTPEGVVVYFQQYDIAPYAGGIREFLIPFAC